ncbi:MAG: hypothetical protein WAK48_17725 [Candidatus Acidiferrum sp.]
MAQFPAFALGGSRLGEASNKFVGHAEQVSQHIEIGGGKADQHGGVSCVVVGQATHREQRRAVRREAPKSTPLTSESSSATIAVFLGNCYSQRDSLSPTILTFPAINPKMSFVGRSASCLHLINDGKATRFEH